MQKTFKPRNQKEITELVTDALAKNEPLEIVGHGSKRALGKTTNTNAVLDMSEFCGIELFEPQELILIAKAGTAMAEIEKLLDEHNQTLLCEPVNLNFIFGGELSKGTKNSGTLGGLVHTNICGSRRLTAGSVRDHILGVKAVSGRGEFFKSGGRVVKNVTGYDLSKGIVGSYGTLAVATEIIMKVMPKPEFEKTFIINGLNDDEAISVMATAMASEAQVASAAHLPSGINGEAKTCFRLEGFKPSVENRFEILAGLLKKYKGEGVVDIESKNLWQLISNVIPFAKTESILWRVSCVPSQAAKLVAELNKKINCKYYYDWQGGLIWLSLQGENANAEFIRDCLAKHGGGHATLVRASDSIKQTTKIFQPQAHFNLSKRVRENFNPHNILNPNRMEI